jgi:hypothetical protein
MITGGPKIVLTYVYPQNGHGGFSTKALEFSLSYQRNPPGMDHETLIVCNGAPATQPSKDLFNALPNASFIDHDNSGWDIGAFQLAARVTPCDMMVFFSSHTYFRKPGWLLRMWETYLALGDTLYGSTGNQGDLRVNVHPHIRTTGFWCSPELLNQHPYRVTQVGGGGQRYEFEHGANCLTNFVKQTGRTPWVVAWDTIRSVDECNSIPGGFHNGDQYNVLVGDRLCKIPYGPDP